MIDAIVQGIVGQIQFSLGFLAQPRFAEVLQVPLGHVDMGNHQSHPCLLIHTIYLLFLSTLYYVQPKLRRFIIEALACAPEFVHFFPPIVIWNSLITYLLARPLEKGQTEHIRLGFVRIVIIFVQISYSISATWKELIVWLVLLRTSTFAWMRN